MSTKVVIIIPGATQSLIDIVKLDALKWLNAPENGVLVIGGGDPKVTARVEIYQFDSSNGEVEVINKVDG